MLKGICIKKRVLIADRKLINWCLKCECSWLRFQVWRVERKMRKFGRDNDIERRNENARNYNDEMFILQKGKKT